MTPTAEICTTKPQRTVELGPKLFSEIFLFFLCITLFLTQNPAYHIEVTES